MRHAFLPAVVSTSGRIPGELLRLLFILVDKKTSLAFLQALPSMSTLRFTAGVGVGFSGACGLPMALRARKPLTKCGISNHRHSFNISFTRTILVTQGM
jgi:hypothetical protein